MNEGAYWVWTGQMLRGYLDVRRWLCLHRQLIWFLSLFPLDALLAMKLDMEYLFHNYLQISPGQKAAVRQGEREHRCLQARRSLC